MGCPTSYGNKSYEWKNGKLARVYRGSAEQAGSLYEDCIFKYNARGQRVSKTVIYDVNPASTSDYSYRHDTAYDYDNSGRLIRQYTTEATTYEGGGINVRREFIFLYDESGIIGVMYGYNDTGLIPYYFLRNLQGDVIAIYDTNGNKVVEYAYDAWGNCTVVSATNSDLASTNPIRYRGYYYDKEIGWYYLNARYYNPQWRRFISPANVNAFNPQTVNGLNLYCYANNNPVGVVCDGLSAGINTHSVSTGYSGYLISSVGAGDSTSNLNLLPIPEWVDLLSTAIDHTFAILNPIRTAAYLSKYSGLWDLMRLDGITELPGALSKVATGVGWSLGVLGGVFTGYEKYASGASIESSIAGAIINAGISIGGMYATAGLASLGIKLLIGLGVSGGAVVVVGAIGAIIIGVAINHLFTKLEVSGNTLEGYLNDFADWLIFWD